MEISSYLLRYAMSAAGNIPISVSVMINTMPTPFSSIVWWHFTAGKIVFSWFEEIEIENFLRGVIVLSAQWQNIEWWLIHCDAVHVHYCWSAGNTWINTRTRHHRFDNVKLWFSVIDCEWKPIVLKEVIYNMTAPIHNTKINGIEDKKWK